MQVVPRAIGGAVGWLWQQSQPAVHEEDVETPLYPAPGAVYQPTTAPIAAAGQHWPTLGTGLGIGAASIALVTGANALYRSMTGDPDLIQPASEPVFAQRPPHVQALLDKLKNHWHLTSEGELMSTWEALMAMHADPALAADAHAQLARVSALLHQDFGESLARLLDLATPTADADFDEFDALEEPAPVRHRRALPAQARTGPQAAEVLLAEDVIALLDQASSGAQQQDQWLQQEVLRKLLSSLPAGHWLHNASAGEQALWLTTTQTLDGCYQRLANLKYDSLTQFEAQRPALQQALAEVNQNELQLAVLKSKLKGDLSPGGSYMGGLAVVTAALNDDPQVDVGSLHLNIGEGADAVSVTLAQWQVFVRQNAKGEEDGVVLYRPAERRVQAFSSQQEMFQHLDLKRLRQSLYAEVRPPATPGPATSASVMALLKPTSKPTPKQLPKLALEAALPAQRAALQRSLAKLGQRPDLWTPEHLQVHTYTGASLQDKVQGWAGARLDSEQARLQRLDANPQIATQTAAAALTEQRTAAFVDEYLPTLRAFTQRNETRALTQALRGKGGLAANATVDADALLITFNGQTMSWTDWVLEGYRQHGDNVIAASNNFLVDARFEHDDSAVLRALGTPGVKQGVQHHLRSTYAGDQYIKYLESWLAPNDPRGQTFRQLRAASIQQQLQVTLEQARVDGTIDPYTAQAFKTLVDGLHTVTHTGKASLQAFQVNGRRIAYSQYLNALLVWQVYQACAGHDPLESEDRLRQLARQLKDYQVVKCYPQLEPLIDLLPLLPLLMEARHSVNVQSSADSWLGWGSQWLNALAGSASRYRSARALHQRLSRQVEHWLADALVAALSKLPMGLPGAAAASTSGAAGRAFEPMSVGLDSHGALLAGISLEAVGLGAIGYALWQLREVGDAGRPVAEVETGLMGAAPRAAGGRGLHDHKAPLLLGITAMVAGGVLLYGWSRKRPMEASEERELDFDLPIYTSYVNEVVAAARRLVEALPAVPLDRRFGSDSGAAPGPSTRSKRNVVWQGAQTDSPTAHSDPTVQLARRVLDFSKYDDLVASKFNRLWRNSITLSRDTRLSIEQKKTLYLTQFHQLLRNQLALMLANLNDLKQEGMGNNSKYRKAIVWMATLAEEAREVQELFASGSQDAYWGAWLDNPLSEQLKELNRAFTIPQLDDETYFEQRQAWMQPSVVDDDDYLHGVNLTNTEKMWRTALVVEQREFYKLIDDYADLKTFGALPELFESALKLRVEILGSERYAQLSEQGLSVSQRVELEVNAQLLDMRKVHLSNMLIEEVESYAICKQLKKYGPLCNKYSGHRAVFEAKKIAVELVLQTFAVESSELDDDNKIIAFYQIGEGGSVSEEVKSYLNKSGALAFFMIVNDPESKEYCRWSRGLSVSFAEASAPTEYFKRLYEARPDDYEGLEAFKKSSESDTWVDYYRQFAKYREKFIEYDAKVMVYSAMVKEGFTDYSVSKMQAEKIVYADVVVHFNASVQVDKLLKTGAARSTNKKFERMLNSPTEFPGTIGFIVQADGGILAIAGIDFKVTVKHFDPAAVDASPVLKKIRSLPAIPYLGTLVELEGRKLIDDVLRPMGIDTDALIGNSGFPLLKAPRKFRTWWERHQMEHLHPRQGLPLMSVADEVMKENLNQWVGVLKVANKDNDFWGVALSFLPLYSELRDAYTDPEHRLDGNRIMWDVAGIVLSVLPAMGAITQLSRIALQTMFRTASLQLLSGTPVPVVTRKILMALMTNPEFTGLGLKGFAYAAYIGIDIVLPIPTELFLYGIMRASKYIRSYIRQGYAAGDSALSALYATASSSQSALAVQARAELAVMGATTRVAVGTDNVIVLRNSLLTAREVIEESRALYRPLARKKTVSQRVQERMSYSIDTSLCAPLARRQVRSLEVGCMANLDYAHAENIVEVGDGYTVYKLDTFGGFYVVKEFRPMRKGDQPLRLRKASNNKVAYNRLYGGRETGYAEVFHSVEDEPVIVLLQPVPGQSLAAIIIHDDRTAMEGLRLLDKPATVEAIVNVLRDMGIQYEAVNFSGILYDSPKRALRLNNFDQALINPRGVLVNTHWETLSTAQVSALKARFTQVLTDFIEQTKDLRPNSLGVDKSLLNNDQFAQLNVQRVRYESHKEIMLAGKTAADFNLAKKNHQGIDVLGVDKSESELVLTIRYNKLSESIDATSLGALSGFIENTRTHRIIHAAISGAVKHSRVLKIGSYRQIIVPQAFWLTAAGAARASEGRCYPLVLAVAVALKEKRVSTFFLNILGSAAQTDKSHNEMIRAIDQVRTLNAADFLRPEFKAAPCDVDTIVRHVTERNITSLFTMDTPSHSMLVGVIIEAFTNKIFYFYDPNIGIFLYHSANAFEEALQGTVGTVSTGTQYAAWNASNLPLYKISLIQVENLKDKILQVPPEHGPGFRLRTVAELSSDLDYPPDCVLDSGLGARKARAPGCTSIESEMMLMKQAQEALLTGQAPPSAAIRELWLSVFV
ncbi:hypothetical protein [Pseudomonas sp. TH31]|uniref:hypothetical protein n=1 Tax=Pseudomonas sp. TH31 TaxID=2796396 RepID=UPI001913FE02|nr:hypothetical protein [Pseudomonas sp. TH31]MBK5415789.1 hypothetical protein [Pseudomonas sp. TH31]